MKSEKNLIAIACAGAILSGAFLAVAVAADQPAGPATMDHSKMGDMKGMQMSKTGDADHDFATMMRQHHQMGIRMAQDEIKNGKNADMKRMAQKIVDAQKQEVSEFDAWLAQHKPAATTK